MKQSVIRSEWWYDDAAFYSDQRTLYLALLHVLTDGTATIQVEQKFYSFASEEEADIWLTSEEFRKVEYLAEDYGLTVIAPTSLPA
ncbi:MAG: hypothetical protein SFU56_11045 [Capsulimonadales bacterium]|nr:hypothetical protein [Capsulimonadales bacterium]